MSASAGPPTRSGDEGTHLSRRVREGSLNAHDRVVASVRRTRPPVVAQEADIYGILAHQFKEDEIGFIAEFVLGPRERIDFLTDGGVGIECKKGHPNGPALLRQLTRYAAHREVRSVVVVLPWSKHLNLPEELNGKRITTLALNRLWGIAV